MKTYLLTFILLLFTYTLAFTQKENSKHIKERVIQPPPVPMPPKISESKERILEKHFLAERLMSSIYIKDTATFKLNYFSPQKIKNIDELFSVFSEISKQIDFSKGRKYGVDYEKDEFGDICCISSYRQFRNHKNQKSFKIIFHFSYNQYSRRDECESIEILNLQEPSFCKKIYFFDS